MENRFNILAMRTPWRVWKSKKTWPWKMNSPSSVGAQYATREEWRNNSRKNEEIEPKWKQCPVVDVTSGESREHCCAGTWNVRSIPFLSFIVPIFAWNVPLIFLIFLRRSLVFPIILFSSVSLHCSLKEASDDHHINSCGQESLRRNGVALIVNNRVQNAVLGCSPKNDRMVSVRFQGKPFNISYPKLCPNQ